MANEMTRREVMKTGLAAAALGAAANFEWVLPALAQGEVMVPFTDSHVNPPFNPTPAPDRRLFDTRTLSTIYTPKDQFFTTQHYGHPEIDPAAYRLKVGGLVNSPLTLSLDELRKMGGARAHRRLRVLRQPSSGAGPDRQRPLDRRAAEDGARQGRAQAQRARDRVLRRRSRQGSVNFRGTNFDVEQQYGRSIQRDQALSVDRAPFLAYELNGDPLTKHQGAPLRLIMPGWYGAPNVKWVSDIFVQEEPYLGKFQANWYRTLRGEMINGEVKWVEKAVSHLQLKSFVARVTKNGSDHKITTIVLNDGTPIKAVEVKVDDGPWMPATLDPQTNAKYGWKLYYYTWKGAPAGEHTLVSRVTDANGLVQPTAEEIESKKTFLEDNSQHPRKIMIACGGSRLSGGLEPAPANHSLL